MKMKPILNFLLGKSNTNKIINKSQTCCVYYMRSGVSIN